MLRKRKWIIIYLIVTVISIYSTNTLCENNNSRTLKLTITDVEAINTIRILKEAVSSETVFEEKKLQGTLKKFNNFKIKKTEIPASEIIMNKPATLYNKNPKEFIVYTSIMATMTVIMIILVNMVDRLNKKNKKLLEIQQNIQNAQALLDKDIAVKEQLEKTIQTTSIIYCLIKDNKIIQVNEYAKSILDMQVSQDIRNYGFYDDKEKTIHYFFDKAMENGAYYNVANLKMKNGKNCRFYIRITKVHYNSEHAYVMWGIDIEKTKIKQDALIQVKGELQKIINSLPIPMIIFEPTEEKIIFANKPYLKMFKSEQLRKGRVDVFETFPIYQSNGKLSRDIFREHIKSLLLNCRTKSWEWEYFINKIGKIETIVFASSVIYDDTKCIMLMIQDMSTKKKEEQLLLNLADQEKLANQLKSDFLVNMSHEIRTPMNAIVGFSEIAIRRNPENEYKETFHKINLSAKNLLSIINDILDFSKIEAEKIDLVEEEFILEDIIANSFMVASEKIDSKPIEMLLDMDPDIPYILIGDKTRLWQILKNLLDNAVKYTDEGRIMLRVYKEREISSDKVSITFLLEDTGLGMDQEQLEKLFSPFERFHTKQKHKITGTGLGMSITNQLINIMGGSLNVKSQINTGSEFELKLEFKILKQETFRTIINKQIDDDTSVLIVDDNKYALEIISKLLNVVGIKPICVSTSEKAIDKIIEKKEKGEYFNIIILDYLLGAENGVQIAKQIKEVTLENSRILMVTAYGKKLIKEEADQAGISGIIEKPFTPTSFIKYICNTINLCEDTKSQRYNRFINAKVLICEDNPLNQEVAVGLLNIFGIQPIIAENGQKAIEMLEIEEVDLVFMDIFMPVLDGHKTACTIRDSNKEYKNVPIIAVTANVMQDEIEQCMRDGMNAHLGKPLNFDEVYEQLLKYLGHKISTEEAGVEVKMEDSIYELLVQNSGINVVEALARFGNKLDRYIKALRSFKEDLKLELPTYEQVIQEDYREEGIRVIHTLKGVSSNLGAVKIYELAGEFEKQLIHYTPDKQVYENLLKECEKIVKIIEQEIGDETIIQATDIGTNEERDNLINELEEALNSYEPLACEVVIEKLKEKRWNNIDFTILNGVCNLINEYQFDEAFNKLEQIKQILVKID